jgi:hypothetical protein
METGTVAETAVEDLPLLPGDTVVVPRRRERLRPGNLTNIAIIIEAFGLGVAAVNLIADPWSIPHHSHHGAVFRSGYSVSWNVATVSVCSPAWYTGAFHHSC